MGCCGNNKFGCEFNADDEGPSAADVARFGSDDFPCPECGEMVYHDSALCQSCGHAITADEGAGVSVGKQVIIGAIGLVTVTAFVLITVL
ncbi:MAG: hypothetical protein ACIAQF_03750 [Phycisphaerales bacterium JB065]